MSSDYYFEARRVSWNSLFTGFAIWIFLITTMFLVDSVNYDTAETNDVVASPNIYISYDVALEGED